MRGSVLLALFPISLHGSFALPVLRHHFSCAGTCRDSPARLTRWMRRVLTYPPTPRVALVSGKRRVRCGELIASMGIRENRHIYAHRYVCVQFKAYWSRTNLSEVRVCIVAQLRCFHVLMGRGSWLFVYWYSLQVTRAPSDSPRGDADTPLGEQQYGHLPARLQPIAKAMLHGEALTDRQWSGKEKAFYLDVPESMPGTRSPASASVCTQRGSMYRRIRTSWRVRFWCDSRSNVSFTHAQFPQPFLSRWGGSRSDFSFTHTHTSLDCFGTRWICRSALSRTLSALKRRVGSGLSLPSCSL